MNYGDDQEKTPFKIIDEGRYIATIVDAKLDTTKVGGPVLKTTWVLDETNAKIWKDFYFRDTCKTINQWQLGVLGVWSELKGVADHGDAALMAAKIVFNMVDKVKCHIEVKHEEWQGKVSAKMMIKDLVQRPVTAADAAPSLDVNEEIPF